jgi:protein NUD1
VSKKSTPNAKILLNCFIELECLRHLRELRADGNIITSLDGLQKMDGLIKLSLHGNRVRSIDLSEYDW